MSNNNAGKEISRRSVFTSFLWRFFERSGAQLVKVVVEIILARLLEPSVYGTIALVSVFTMILNVFIDSGFGNALIQKKNPDDLDFSTVFYFNITICTILYIGMFIASPYIAAFYRDPSLVPVIRVLSITLLISGLKNVQQAYVSKHMLFKRFFFATLGGTLGAAVVGIFMAYNGFGVWALVAQQLFNASMDTLILWITVRWRPKRLFSLKRLKSLFSYGWKLLASSLLDTGYNELRQLIIGRMYTSSDLAFYNRGRVFPNVIVNNIDSSINSVLLPTMASEQDDPARVRAMTRRAIKTSTFIIAPFLMGLAFMASNVVKLILTDKWLPCVPFLVIFCITYMFYPIHTANLNAIKALGRSDLFLRLEILKKVVGVIALLITFRISVMAMAYSLLFTSISSQIINSWPNKNLLNYSYLNQVRDIMPNIAISIAMGSCLYMMKDIRLPLIIVIIIQVISGAVIYIILSKLTHNDSFEYVKELLLGFIKYRERREKV